jgi:predicted nucleic acid-binding Zn ribbon protein
MPTYQYRCKECGGSVRRVVGSVGIVFKGSGFYVTDNRSSNGKGRVKTTEKSSASSDKTKEDGKSDKADRPSNSDAKSEK